MTSVIPDINPSGRYSIKEACAILGIHRNTLRKFTLAGRIRVSFRKGTMRKFYKGTDIKRFWLEEL